jgi:hypothetical protein
VQRRGEEVERALEARTRAQEALLDADRRENEFLARLSDELRTPRVLLGIGDVAGA